MIWNVDRIVVLFSADDQRLLSHDSWHDSTQLLKFANNLSSYSRFSLRLDSWFHWLAASLLCNSGGFF